VCVFVPHFRSKSPIFTKLGINTVTLEEIPTPYIYCPSMSDNNNMAKARVFNKGGNFIKF